MKEDQGLINYLTNIILRPHREIYGIQKLGPSKIVVKSHQKSLSVLESTSLSQKNIPKQMQQNYCQLIQVNRREVTIRNQEKCIQASIYQPQLTIKQKNSTGHQSNSDKLIQKSVKPFFPLHSQQKLQPSYENCVIFLHANSGSRIQGTQYAKHILQYRTLCVSFDYTGSGISQGQYTTMGVNESKDLSAVIQYLSEKYSVKKFSLWGRSMGAVTGIYYILTKYKEDAKRIRVTSCIIDSPFSDLEKLILEIASKKSSLPRFVFQPFLNVMQKDITQKIGINILSELKLVQKITSLSVEQRKLLNSVSFLGLASKEDKMINKQHCEELCQLLISSDVRSSDLIDEKNLIVKNLNDKHLMMLVEFKKQINTKGDFIQIQGDHNKPRSNQVKEKISFFIQDNFISYRDPFPSTQQISSINSIKETQKPITFSKTGLSIKNKLSSTKAAQKNGLKSRKDSQTIKQPVLQEPKSQQTISGHNYNLINLKQIKAKQQNKQSLSKEKESIRNSLSKTFLLKEKRFQNGSLQTGPKGLNIVSRKSQKERAKPNQQNQNNLKKPFETLQNSKHFYYPNEVHKHPGPSTFASFLNKARQIENKQKSKQRKTSLNCVQKSCQNISQNSDSVNNSIKKQNKIVQGRNQQEGIRISALNLSENNVFGNEYPNLTQRLLRPEKQFEGLPSQRYNRNAQSQTYVYQNKLQQSPGISTTPFNLSMDNGSNLSFEMHNSIQEQSFRKKQSSQIVDATDLSYKKQAPKTPQVKISISEFRNRQQDESNKRSVNKKYQPLIKKQNNFAQANSSTTHWSLNNNHLKQSTSICPEEKLQSKNLFQFRKREPAQTNSIHKSNLSCQQSMELGQNACQNRNINFPNQCQRPQNSKHYQLNNSNKPQNVSSSFTQNSISMKQMMISNGHKGLTQSSTFNGHRYSNPSYQYQQKYAYPQPPYQTQTTSFFTACNQKPLSSNAYYSSNGQGNVVGSGGMVKSMRTSQEQYLKQVPRTMNGMQNNIFFQSRNPSQAVTYCHNQESGRKGDVLYEVQNPYQLHQLPKQQIQYKTKITKLLD